MKHNIASASRLVLLSLALLSCASCASPPEAAPDAGDCITFEDVYSGTFSGQGLTIGYATITASTGEVVLIGDGLTVTPGQVLTFTFTSPVRITGYRAIGPTLWAVDGGNASPATGDVETWIRGSALDVAADESNVLVTSLRYCR